MATGRVRGFEALARWTKDGVAISPGEFIPVAEATGQVVDIDLWGLRKSTYQVASWIRIGRFPVSISANLSPLLFRNDDIVGHVARALADSRLPPHLLTLEITESVLIEDLSKVTIILEKLRQLGVRIALDDFGTGYSSLAYLRRLDVDYIKIDQSFVRDLEQSTETQLILDALVDIAKGLKKMLVVEGIETENQADIVRNLGCDLGQGFLWGRPMPEKEALENVPLVAEVFEEAQSA
jgi:EAL domain-containing protein (putative c-di-GMP-specific phosphodiesterase class I)